MAVTLRAEWTETLPAFYTISNMQDMTSTVCNSVQTPTASAATSVTKDTYSTYGKSTSYIPETTLTDSRDSQQYVVRKLADGNCWMVQSLKLNGGRTIYKTDSNISANSITLPSNLSTSSGINSNGNDIQIFTRYSESYGNLYNFCAASATQNCSSTNNEITNSICPKGWRIPSGGSITSKSWENLFSIYSLPTDNTTNNSAATKARSFPLSFTTDGIYHNSAANNGSLYYWSRTPYGANLYYTWISLNGAFYAHDTSQKARAQSIRCVSE